MATPASPGGAGSRASAGLVAREAELARLDDLMTRTGDGCGAAVLEGEPGVGKTSLWDRGVSLGASLGLRVLTARASASESGLAFTTLIDLLDDVAADELASLPVPQREALDVALYRAEPTEGPPDPHAIALGLLSALRTLTTERPLLVAIDDLQWVDRQSEEALAYAVRRLDREPVVLLLARRPGHRGLLEVALAGRVQEVRLGPASLGVTRQILSSRLGLRLPHHVLRRVFDTTLGNPLFSLEVGRMLSGQDLDRLGEDIPLPEDVEDLLGTRVADLHGSARRALLALSLDGDLRVEQLRRLVGTDFLDQAGDAVVVDGDRVRASHPLLAAAAKRQAYPRDVRDLHRALAGVLPDEQRRVLHLALATSTPDNHLAARLTAAAHAAAARGATMSAVELAGHALRLTEQGGSSTYVERLLGLSEHLALAGEKRRLSDLLDGRIMTLPPGRARVTAYVQLTNGVIEGNDDIRRLLDSALAEAGDDPGLRAPVLAQLAENQAVIEVIGIGQADAWATESLALATGHPEHERFALYALAWTRCLRGRAPTGLTERYHAVADHRAYLAQSPERVLGQRLVWRGEVDRARPLLEDLRRTAGERTEPSSYALQRLHLCELELRVGRWGEAERLLDEWADSTDRELLHWPMYERCRALLAAGRGRPGDAQRWGEDALARARATGVGWDRLEASRALGLAALLRKDPDAAVQHLGAVWQHTELEGVLDPGAFPAAPDYVEALVDAGAPEQAATVTARLAELGRDQQHPWALTGAVRSTAVVELATDGYGARVATALGETSQAYRRAGLLFDEARTLLVLGRAQRRARKWGAARDTLTRAVSAFEELGSDGWSADARTELARVGARRPNEPGRLTDTEDRTARLAADGLSNKEIARTLLVTVNTVEFHLRNAYAKLGVRSRSQLAAALPPRGPAPWH